MAKAKYGEQNGKNASPSKLQQIRARSQANNGSGGRADYATATPAWLAAAIAAVAGEGGAIQFGYSRDGGVYTIVILLDGEIEKHYVKQSEGIDNFLEELYGDFTRSTDPTFYGSPEDGSGGKQR